MNPFNIRKNAIKLELPLSIAFFTLPILLPIFSGELLSSVSHYAHSKVWWLYSIILLTISTCLILDGIIDRSRRFNILLGLSMLGVLLFPVEGYRYIHDTFAILFFLENLTILIYHTRVLSKRIKLIMSCVIVLTLLLFAIGLISLFFAEAIGLFCVGTFFLIRFNCFY